MTRVLIIDDEPSLTRLLKLALEKLGAFEVRAENTGKAGLAAAREFRPHVVLLDIVLPDLSGGEISEALQADAALRDTPVIFMTALLKSAAGNMAGRTVLAKPVKLDALAASIEAVSHQAAATLSR